MLNIDFIICHMILKVLTEDDSERLPLVPHLGLNVYLSQIRYSAYSKDKDDIRIKFHRTILQWCSV